MAKVDKRKRQLLYVTVHDKIKDLINSEGLKPGDRLPSEAELITRLKVSRGTLLQALALLRESGLIYKQQGKGTFVSPPNQNAVGLEKAKYDVTQFAAATLDSRTLTVDYVPSSKTVQEYMEHSASILMARFQILYYHADEVVAYRIFLIPFSKLNDAGIALDDTDELMEFADDFLRTHFISTEMTIDFVEARESVARYMSSPKDARLFCITEIARDKTHAAAAYSKFYCHPEYFKFRINRS